MSNDLLLEQKLRMQLIAGLINESQYYTLVQEGVLDKIKDRSIEVIAAAAAKVMPQKVKERLKDFMLKTFGTLTPEVSALNAEELSNSLGLREVKLTEADSKFKPNESVLVKVLERLRQVAGVNLISLTVPLQYILNKAGMSLTQDTRGDMLMIPAVSMVVMAVLVKLMSLLGYTNKGGQDMIDTPKYRSEDDIREKGKNKSKK